MRLAVVIPVLDEAPSLSSALDCALEVGDLVVVADGGSRDGSVDLARRHGAVVVPSSRGRGAQLNAGASAALADGADVILFLHADTRLPDGARRLVEGAVAGGAVGGGFEVRFDDPRAIFTLGSRLVNLRSRLFGVPLGDQAQWATKEAFLAVAGFRDWPILEDLDLVRRLGRHGRIAVLPGPAVTAARRFIERGILRTVGTNWLIVLLFLVGVKPRRLARLYPHVR